MKPKDGSDLNGEGSVLHHSETGEKDLILNFVWQVVVSRSEDCL